MSVCALEEEQLAVMLDTWLMDELRSGAVDESGLVVSRTSGHGLIIQGTDFFLVPNWG